MRATGWLDPVRAALDRLDSGCTFFFRDDDAGWADERLFALLSRFERHGVRADVAVIPAAATPALARRLRSIGHATGIRVHQHGLSHANHEVEARKCEFGAARAADVQAADVAAGRDLMRATFGDLVDPIFTPPWNRCTPMTGDALVAAGLEVLSRDVTAPRLDRPDLIEVAVSVDWFGRRKGVPLTRAELAAQIADRVGGDHPVGVMLHHAVTDDDELARIDDLLDLVAAHPAVDTAVITELAAAQSPRAGPPPHLPTEPR
jgi:peptidoglycan/xylan/chitin deacetylase (PgdA/CDA1 family)